MRKVDPRHIHPSADNSAKSFFVIGCWAKAGYEFCPTHIHLRVLSGARLAAFRSELFTWGAHVGTSELEPAPQRYSWNVSSHPYLLSDNPIAFAHRGGAAEAPENTVEAFQHAIDLGYRYIETDAQLSADGIPVAFHDSSVDRVTDREGAVSELTWDELSELIVHPEQGGGRLASIEQLLRDFPDTRFNIDAKTTAVVDPLLDVIEAADALDRVCVASFFDHRLAKVRDRVGDSGCVSQGPFDTIITLARGKFGAASDSIGNRPMQLPDTLGPLPMPFPQIVAAGNATGSPVHVWTVDDPARMHELFDMGVHGIMTDRPTVLRDVLIERGQWSDAS